MIRGSAERLYDVHEVAERLHLHDRTIRRYIREGKLPARRIGKEYRITRAALDEFAGTSESSEDSGPQPTQILVSSIVDVDGISRAESDRMSALVVALLNAHKRAPDGPRVDILPDARRERLRIMITASPTFTCELLRSIDAFADRRRVTTSDVVLE